MRKPRALRPGDRVAVVAPASPFKREEFDAGLTELRSLGFDPVYEDSVFARQGYVAGAPDVRAAAFLRAWEDPTIAALVAARGGYGSVQLLPLLDRQAIGRETIARHAKAFIGYSDNTSLLSWLTLQCGVVSFHGPMIEGRLARGDAGYDRDTFVRCLCRPEPAGEIAHPQIETIAPGEAGGMLLGGTLTQLTASLGTPYAFDPPPGFVLFLDEVGERPFRIDRMLTQLRLSGILDRASAVVFGELPRCDEPDGNPTARSMIAGAMAGFRGPVLFGLPSGHSSGATVTLPLGVRAIAIADRRPRLVIEEAAVS
jgi:muramoyltetrapeptide carboxypeptidase